MGFSEFDKSMMIRALALSRKAGNRAAPNPMVGAVITSDNEVVGFGYHSCCGSAHAETEALKMAGARAQGATMYVTLEPCNHYGRTPPCTEGIISAGISRVHVALRDPNPKVYGGGIEALRAAGIDVRLGLCDKLVKQVNKTWLHWLKNEIPFVTLKLAMTLDGKLGWKENEELWLSDTVSRAMVQRMRAQSQAVLVGVQTIIKDDSRLTCRLVGRGQPTRIVLDSHLRIPLESYVVKTARDVAPTIIACTENYDQEAKEKLESCGVKVVVCPVQTDGRVDVSFLLKHLGKLGINSMLCEGGAEVAKYFIRGKYCDAIVFFQTQEFIGDAGVPFLGQGDCIELYKGYCLQDVRTTGHDILIIYGRS